MRKSQILFAWMIFFVVLTIIFGMFMYMDAFGGIWSGYLALLFMLPAICLSGLITLILIFAMFHASNKETELALLEEKPVPVMTSKELLIWLIICFILFIVSGVVTLLASMKWYYGEYVIIFTLLIMGLFGFITFHLLFRWRLRRREEAEAEEFLEMENEYLDIE